MKKVRNRRRRHITHAEALARAYRTRCWQVDTTPAEIEFLAIFSLEARAILLSIREKVENDANPYQHKRGAI